MKCRVCGGSQHAVRTDLPFKVAESTIVILKDTPALQCANSSECSPDDVAMERVGEGAGGTARRTTTVPTRAYV